MILGQTLETPVTTKDHRCYKCKQGASSNHLYVHIQTNNVHNQSNLVVIAFNFKNKYNPNICGPLNSEYEKGNYMMILILKNLNILFPQNVAYEIKAIFDANDCNNHMIEDTMETDLIVMDKKTKGK